LYHLDLAGVIQSMISRRGSVPLMRPFFAELMMRGIQFKHGLEDNPTWLAVVVYVDDFLQGFHNANPSLASLPFLNTFLAANRAFQLPY